MQEYQIIDEKRYPLKVHRLINDLSPGFIRWEHRVTVGRRGRRFMAYMDTLRNLAYIEEITSGQLEVIKDDELFEDLHRWINERGFLNILLPKFN
jgi:hypothetical protein